MGMMVACPKDSLPLLQELLHSLWLIGLTLYAAGQCRGHIAAQTCMLCASGLHQRRSRHISSRLLQAGQHLSWWVALPQEGSVV